MGIEDNAEGRSRLEQIFEQGLKGPEVARSTNIYGTTIRRSVIVEGPRGVKGAIEVGYFYEGGNLNTTPKVTTIIPKIHKRK